jgi:hypothetical protein
MWFNLKDNRAKTPVRKGPAKATVQYALFSARASYVTEAKVRQQHIEKFQAQQLAEKATRKCLAQQEVTHKAELALIEAQKQHHASMTREECQNTILLDLQRAWNKCTRLKNTNMDLELKLAGAQIKVKEAEEKSAQATKEQYSMQVALAETWVCQTHEDWSTSKYCHSLDYFQTFLVLVLCFLVFFFTLCTFCACQV